MVKVSIIIPIYNVDNYIDKCLQSLLKQTLSDIELICINDGSTDNSLEILQQYANKDARIKIVNQPNQGQGIARNNGIKIATGKYISFVDPDDWVELYMLEKLTAIAEVENADLVESNFVTYDELSQRKDIFKYNYKFPERKSFDWKFDNDYLFGGMFAPWNKLFRADFIKDNNVVFSNTKYAEDHIFTIKSRILAKKISFCEEPLYVYRIRKNSCFNSCKSMEVLKRPKLYEDVRDFLISKNLYNVLQNRFENYVLNSALYNYEKVPNRYKNLYDKECKHFMPKGLYKKYRRELISKFIENVFSVKNVYISGIKYKRIKFLGLNIFEIRRQYANSKK